jgi:hypothetical protein
MAWLVEFDPAPAMTRVRPRAISTAVRTMLPCSIGVSVEASPAVSPTTMAETPASIWRSQSFANAAGSSSPFSSKGVGTSGM